jgi:hypothetical protein
LALLRPASGCRILGGVLADEGVVVASAQTVVNAVRLALEGAADEGVAVEMIQALVAKAPAAESADRESPRLLVETMNELGATFVVNQR